MKSFDKLERAIAETSEIPKALNISPELDKLINEILRSFESEEHKKRQKP